MQQINYIKPRRESMGLNRRMLAELTGIPMRTLEKWEQGVQLPMDAVKLYRIASVLNCKIADLINWEAVENEN